MIRLISTCLEHFFDVILTDVPCSGEGMFRKDATAVTEWSQENVDVCWKRQRRILADIGLHLSRVDYLFTVPALIIHTKMKKIFVDAT